MLINTAMRWVCNVEIFHYEVKQTIIFVVIILVIVITVINASLYGVDRVDAFTTKHYKTIVGQQNVTAVVVQKCVRD